MMKIEIREKEQYKTSEWSGGRTTELYIYPENSDYTKRDFLIRVSSATVELEESTFTKLENVKRKLMILEGEMKLVHKNHRECFMKPYDIDSFMGDWDTISYGKVRDFNLMIHKNMDSNMFFYNIENTKKLSMEKHEREQKLLIYVIEGQGKIDNYIIESSKLIVINDYQGEVYQLENTGNSGLKLVICQVIL